MSAFTWDRSGPAKLNARRWNREVPGWAKTITEHWLGFQLMLVVLPPLLPCLLLDYWIRIPDPWFQLLVLAGVGAWGKLLYRRIPNLPTATVAMISILDHRIPIVLEGFVFMIPNAKGLMNIELVDMKKIDNDFKVDKIDARLESQVERQDGVSYFSQLASLLSTTSSIAPPRFGGKVEIDVQAVLVPDASDPWAIWDLLDMGNVTGAVGIFDGKFSDTVRQVGRVLETVELMFLSDMITAYVITTLTDVKGIPGEGNLFDNPTEDKIRRFLRYMKENARARIEGTPLILKSLNIPNISPIGRLAEVIENVGIEKVKRDTLRLNTKALAENIRTLMGSGRDKSVSRRDALEALQLEDGIGSRQTTVFKLADKELMEKILPLLVQLVANRGSGITINTGRS